MKIIHLLIWVCVLVCVCVLFIVCYPCCCSDFLTINSNLVLNNLKTDQASVCVCGSEKEIGCIYKPVLISLVVCVWRYVYAYSCVWVCVCEYQFTWP